MYHSYVQVEGMEKGVPVPATMTEQINKANGI